MAEPFLSEIRLVGFNFAPRGWALADGQTMSIQQNTATFSLIGTTYGGDGIRTFQLPNLQGRAVVGQLDGYSLGEVAGEVAHTLTLDEMPLHSHTGMTGSSTALGTKTSPSTQSFNVPAVPARLGTLYSLTGGAEAGEIVQTAGGGQGHDNMQPYLVLNYIIALQGIFPTRN